MSNHNGNANKMVSDTPRTDAVARINEYLGVGGLFNPEILNVQQHEAVRDTLIQARDELNAANAKIKQLEDNRTKAAANSLANMLAYEEAIAKIKRLEEALVKIIKEVPAHDGCGGLFLPRFDGDGNEIGVQAVDPIKVIGAMHARALDAISRQCA